MLKEYAFKIGQEVAIVSEAQDLSKLRGDKATVVCFLPTSNNHDYIIKLEDNKEIKVKQTEIQAINKELLEIRTGDKVIYAPTNEEATITKIDYMHGVIGIQFEDKGSIVVGIEQIRKIENEGENVADYKFKNGDKVKVNTKDEWNGKKGVVIGTEENSSRGYFYNVVFNEINEMASFKENELVLIEGVSNVVVEEFISTDHELHKQILDEIHHTYKIKNADYGNSFGEQYEEHGMLSAVIRLDDKMRRLKQLMKQDAQVKDESIEDTILDLSNYAIMTVMELRKCKIK